MPHSRNLSDLKDCIEEIIEIGKESTISNDVIIIQEEIIIKYEDTKEIEEQDLSELTAESIENVIAI
jgi:hypothetical protein